MQPLAAEFCKGQPVDGARRNPGTAMLSVPLAHGGFEFRGAAFGCVSGWITKQSVELDGLNVDRHPAIPKADSAG
jgi:hypothetical protein